MCVSTFAMCNASAPRSFRALYHAAVARNETRNLSQRPSFLTGFFTDLRHRLYTLLGVKGLEINRLRARLKRKVLVSLRITACDAQTDDAAPSVAHALLLSDATDTHIRFGNRESPNASTAAA